MVRLEREGDSFVLVTGNVQKLDISVLFNALSELQKNSPDRTRIKDGLLYLDNSTGNDLKKEIRNILQKAIDNKGMTITDL
ncbi:Uncharacterised protein [uncultured archaeon]|nr:Uncharacterised protein [uncultured archaeon]